MNRQELRDHIESMPQPVALFRVVTVPEEDAGSLFEGDVLYTDDGTCFYISHSLKHNDPSIARSPCREVAIEDPMENFNWSLEPEHLEFMSFDYL